MNNYAYAYHKTKGLLRKGKKSCSQMNTFIPNLYCFTVMHAKMSEVVFFNG